MRTYKSVTKPQKKCYHGILIKKHCLDCIEFEIRSYQTSIRVLQQTRRIIIKDGLV